MVDTVTPVLDLVKPEVGASTDTWGPKLNTNQDKIDALFSDPVKKVLKLLNGGTGADTAAGARTNLGLGALATLNTVATAQISDGAVTDIKIAANAVTTVKILDAAVTAAKLASGVGIPIGTKMLFQQTAAPTGWTKDTTHDNKALRVVSGTAGSGGTVNFTTAFTNRTSGSTAAAGTVGDTALTVAQMPLHGHPFRLSITNQGSSGIQQNTTGGLMMSLLAPSNQVKFTGTPTNTAGQQIGGEGGDEVHTHTFTGTGHTHTLDLAVQYVDLIIATKN